MFKAISMYQKGDRVLEIGWEQLIAEIERRSEGQLVIDWIGGSDIMPLAEQFPAVQSGVVDMGVLWPSFYAGIEPSAYFTYVTTVPPSELAASGLYDYIRERQKKIGVYYWGPNSTIAGAFHLQLTKDVARPQHLAWR